MRRFEVSIACAPNRGALLRALALVERRGFHVVEVHAVLREECVEASIVIESAERSVENLCHQLAKLADVLEAKC